MGFKLGKRTGPKMSYGNLRTKMRFGQEAGGDASVPGTPIIRKPLDEGILGEANMDGSIYISDQIIPGSHEEKQVIIHEMVHMTDMKTGKLGYTDEAVTYMGETFPRHKGRILYNKQWVPEGSKDLPWERMPWE